MTFKSKIILGSIVLLLLLISAIIVVARSKQPSENGSGTATTTESIVTGDLKNSVPENAARLKIQGKSGVVETDNFLTNIQLRFNGYVEFVREPGYVLGFDGQSQQFYIKTQAYTATEFRQIRLAAEVRFVTTLGVSTEEACNLKVEIQNGAAPDAAEIDYFKGPLSYCN